MVEKLTHLQLRKAQTSIPIYKPEPAFPHVKPHGLGNLATPSGFSS